MKMQMITDNKMKSSAYKQKKSIMNFSPEIRTTISSMTKKPVNKPQKNEALWLC